MELVKHVLFRLYNTINRNSETRTRLPTTKEVTTNLFFLCNFSSIFFVRRSINQLIMAAAQPSNPIPARTTYLPLDRPVVVIGPEFLAQYPVDLTLSGKAWTFGENDFKVSDFNGVLIFQIKSKHFSMHDRRFMKNAAGQTMVSLKQKIMTVHRRWEAFRGESTDEKDLIFSARKSSVLQFKTQLDVFLAANKAEQVPDFRVKGSWAESSCTVFLGDSNTIIAQMYRKHNLKSAMLDTDCYNVTIYPNVDYAFIVALIVILDEINADRSGQD